jgi:ABC-type protease/lipase transport system fused ATPase/permease subunit
MIAGVGFAFVLAMAALLASLIVRHTPGSIRYYVQFAALLYLAFAFAVAGGLVLPNTATAGAAAAGSILVCALAPVCLAVAVFASFEHRTRAWAVAIILLIACLAGLFSAVTSLSTPAFGVLFLSVCAMLALAVRKSRRDWRPASEVIVANLCLIAGAASAVLQSDSGQIALALFSAAALLGIALGVSRKSGAAIEDSGNVLLLEPIDLRR